MGIFSSISRAFQKADFWDKEENQRQQAQWDREDAEKLEAKRSAAVNSIFSSSSSPYSRTNTNNYSQPSNQGPLAPSVLDAQAQEQQKPLEKKPLAAFNNPLFYQQEQAPVSPEQEKTRILEKLYEANLEKAKKQTNDGESWLSRNLVNRGAVNNRAESRARTMAAQDYMKKYGTGDSVLSEYMKKTTDDGAAESARLKKGIDHLNVVSDRLYKVAEKGSYVPGFGTAFNLGLAGSEKLASSLGNEEYADELGAMRTKVDFGMTQEEFDALDPEMQNKLRNLQKLGLIASPLDLVGSGALAKSAVVGSGKAAFKQSITQGTKAYATKQAIKAGGKTAIKESAVPFVAGTALGTGAQAYLGGTENMSIADALKAGVTGAGLNQLVPTMNPKKMGVTSAIDSATDASTTAAKTIEAPELPGIIKKTGAESKPSIEIEAGVKSTNAAKIPDPTSNFALAKAADSISSEVPMADFKNPVDGSQLRKMDPRTEELDRAMDIVASADSAEQLNRAQATVDSLREQGVVSSADSAPTPEVAPVGGVDSNGNPLLVSDAQAAQEALDNGIIPQAEGSVSASREAEMTAAKEALLAEEFKTPAPRTRQQVIERIVDDGARAEVEETLLPKGSALNIEEVQAEAKIRVRQMDDAALSEKFASEIVINNPSEYFETVAAVDRLGRSNTPEGVRALTNAMESIQMFSSNAGRDLRMVKELFKNMPAPMKKNYMIDRIEKKLGADLPDAERASLIEMIDSATGEEVSVNSLKDSLDALKNDIETGIEVDPEVGSALIKKYREAQSNYEYLQGDVWDYSQSLMPKSSVGKRVAQGVKTSMLSSPLRRLSDPLVTGVTQMADVRDSAVSGLIGKVLNKATGNSGQYREFAPSDVKSLVKGNLEGAVESAKTLKTDRRRVPDFMGELQRATRADSQSTRRTRAGRFVGDMTEAATKMTQGSEVMRARELARQDGQKLKLKGKDLDLYTDIGEVTLSTKQRLEAQDFHMKTNNLHQTKLNSVITGMQGQIERALPNAGPLINAATLPFKSWQAGNLTRLVTDKNMAYNVYSTIKNMRNGNTQGAIDDIGRFAGNASELALLGLVLSQSGMISDTDDNGEDFNGPFVQVAGKSIPVSSLGPSMVNVIGGHTISKYMDSDGDPAVFNEFAEQFISSTGASNLVGDNPLQEMVSGYGDFSDRAVKATGDILRRPIPSALTDVNSVIDQTGLNPTGERSDTRVENPDGTKDYLSTELNKFKNKIPGLSQTLPRAEGKNAKSPLDRVTNGTSAVEANEETRIQESKDLSLGDQKRQLDKLKIPTTAERLADLAEEGDYKSAVLGAQYKVNEVAADPDSTNGEKRRAQEKLEDYQFGEEYGYIPSSDKAVDARAERGEYDAAIAGYEYRLARAKLDPDAKDSDIKADEDEIGRYKIYRDGEVEPEMVTAYEKRSSSDGGIGVTKWRELMASGDADEVAYAEKLAKLDEALFDAGLVEKKKYYYLGGSSGSKGRSSSGGGSGGSGKAAKFSTNIATNNAKGYSFTPLQAKGATYSQAQSSIPQLQKVASYSRKLKKIGVNKGGRG